MERAVICPGHSGCWARKSNYQQQGTWTAVFGEHSNHRLTFISTVSSATPCPTLPSCPGPDPLLPSSLPCVSPGSACACFGSLVLCPEVSCNRRGGFLSPVYCYLQMDLQNGLYSLYLIWVPIQSFDKSFVYIFILQMRKVRFWEVKLPIQGYINIIVVWTGDAAGSSLCLLLLAEIPPRTLSSSPKADPLLPTGWRPGLGRGLLPDSFPFSSISQPLFPVMLLPLS